MKRPCRSTLRFTILFGTCLLLFACATIDIFPVERRQERAPTLDGVTLQEIQVQVRQKVDPGGMYVAGTGTDIWN
jgi:hypothetical protein